MDNTKKGGNLFGQHMGTKYAGNIISEKVKFIVVVETVSSKEIGEKDIITFLPSKVTDLQT